MFSIQQIYELTNTIAHLSILQNFDCRNHIRVIQPVGADHSRLYLCGTNAHNPKDWIVNVSALRH